MQKNIKQYIENMGQMAKAAARKISTASAQKKQEFLIYLADLLRSESKNILTENDKDMAHAKAASMNAPRLDRLRLSVQHIEDMAKACIFVAHLPDPIGAMTEQHKQPNGILVGRMQIPLGVIAMIYESRPNVTIDAAILCLKAGNAVILRGGSEAYHSNMILASLLQKALCACDLPKECAQMVEVTDRESIWELCELHEYIDVIIPRGGEEMVRAISKKATMPVLKHDKGVPHAFIDECADIQKSLAIIHNAKVQRPGVCNALEGLLVHEKIAPLFLPLLAEKLEKDKVIFHACPKSLPLLGKNADPIQEKHKGHEFGALELAVSLVANIDEALEYIYKYGSHHTEIICTNNYQHAQRFLREADAAMVAVNASSRFNDGSQLGLGAEIGICTSKLHAYGPMGVNELTCTKFVVYGDGQIRQ